MRIKICFLALVSLFSNCAAGKKSSTADTCEMNSHSKRITAGVEGKYSKESSFFKRPSSHADGPHLSADLKGGSKPGYMVYGYDFSFSNSKKRYLAFELRGHNPVGQMLNIDIYNKDSKRVLASKQVSHESLKDNKWVHAIVEFSPVPNDRLELRAWWYGTANLDIRNIEFTRKPVSYRFNNFIESPEAIYLNGASSTDDRTKHRRIRVVHISDTHNQFEYHRIPDGDILVHSGDITNEGGIEEVKGFLKIMNPLPHKHKILVMGNHDEGWDRKDPSEVRKVLGSQIHWLQEEGITVEGIRFWGASWNDMGEPQAWGKEAIQRRNTNWKNIDDVWGEIPEDTQVLITHMPPYKKLDIKKGKHMGSQGLLDQIIKLKIPMHLFGHAHSNNACLKEESTLFCNAAVHPDRKDPRKKYGAPIVIDVYVPLQKTLTTLGRQGFCSGKKSSKEFKR